MSSFVGLEVLFHTIIPSSVDGEITGVKITEWTLISIEHVDSVVFTFTGIVRFGVHDFCGFSCSGDTGEFEDAADHLSDPVMYFVFRRLGHERRRRNNPVGDVNVSLVKASVKEFFEVESKFYGNWQEQNENLDNLLVHAHESNCCRFLGQNYKFWQNIE